MRKWICVCLMLVGASASAQWTEVAVSTSGTQYFVKVDSIEKDGQLRRYWTLESSKFPDKDGDYSYRSVAQVDCKGRRFRYLQQEYFAQPMAGGKPTGSAHIASPWQAVPSKAAASQILKFVCAR